MSGCAGGVIVIGSEGEIDKPLSNSLQHKYASYGSISTLSSKVFNSSALDPLAVVGNQYRRKTTLNSKPYVDT